MEATVIDEKNRIASAQQGDADARRWLAEQYSGPLFRFSVRMLCNEQDALDAAQDTLIKILNHLDRFDNERRFSTWAFGIARNTCIDILRRRRRQAPMPEREIADHRPSPSELTEREINAERLLEALAQLSPSYREVLVLYHFEHLKYREIADVLNQPIGTIMNRIFRARQQLREIFDNLEATPGLPKVVEGHRESIQRGPTP